MVFDIDKFISCIQNNPSIWEFGSKDYMDRNIKQKVGTRLANTCLKIGVCLKSVQNKIKVKLYFILIISSK